jgi:hypothetical protein
MAHCCESMRFNVESTCDMHPDRFDCADCLIHQRADGQYGIIIHDGGSATAVMQFCPWCGTKLPGDPSLPETPEAT